MDRKRRSGFLSANSTHCNVSYQNIPLIEMIRSGDEAALRVLQEYSTPLLLYSMEDTKGNYPFHAAAEVGNVQIFECMRSLLPVSSYPFAKLNQKGESPLLLAVIHNRLPMVDYLLSNGSSIEETNSSGMTSLLIAAREGHLAIQWLLDNGCTIGEKDENGRTSLLHASEHGHLETVQWLLDNGSSIEEEDHEGCTSLLSASSGGHLGIIQYLIEKGSSIEERDIAGGSSLFFAAMEGHLATVQWLLNNGCSIEDRDDYGYLALTIAAMNNHVEVVKDLLMTGACSEGILEKIHKTPSFELLETLVDYGGANLEEIRGHCTEEHFSSFMEEMRRKKTNKRAAH